MLLYWLCMDLTSCVAIAWNSGMNHEDVSFAIFSWKTLLRFGTCWVFDSCSGVICHVLYMTVRSLN